MRQTSKLHPHLKAFIRNVVMTEMVGPSESYLYKEEFMRRVQTAVLTKLDEVHTQEELAALVDEEVMKLQKSVEADLVMIKQVLRMVPLGVLKELSGRGR